MEEKIKKELARLRKLRDERFNDILNKQISALTEAGQFANLVILESQIDILEKLLKK